MRDFMDLLMEMQDAHPDDVDLYLNLPPHSTIRYRNIIEPVVMRVCKATASGSVEAVAGALLEYESVIERVADNTSAQEWRTWAQWLEQAGSDDAAAAAWKRASQTSSSPSSDASFAGEGSC